MPRFRLFRSQIKLGGDAALIGRGSKAVKTTAINGDLISGTAWQSEAHLTVLHRYVGIRKWFSIAFGCLLPVSACLRIDADF